MSLTSNKNYCETRCDMWQASAVIVTANKNWLLAILQIYCQQYGWLGSRVVSVDSGTEGPRFKSQSWRCRVTVLGKLFTPMCLCSPSSKIGSSHLEGCGVTAGLAESNGSLPPGLWLTSPAGWLPRTGISSGTLRSVIEYGLLLPFLLPTVASRPTLGLVQQRFWTQPGH